MGVAYSEDLRWRVLKAIDGGMSKMQAHRTFVVSRSTIDDWIALRSATGGVRAKTPARRGPAPAISDLEAFAGFAQRHNGATLSQMAQAWQRETGQALSINTFSLALKRLGWTRKKRASSIENVIRSNALSSSNS